MTLRSLSLASALVLASLTLAACSAADQDDLMNAEGVQQRGHGHHAMGSPDADIGTTAGWLNGKNVTFFYNKEFDCILPAETADGEVLTDAAGETDCILAAEAIREPRGGNDPVLYVITPLFINPVDPNADVTRFTGIDEELHCGLDCINHPGDLDIRPFKAVLESILGPLPEAIPTPVHSHIVGVQRGGWWKIEVNGVVTPEAWAFLETHKSLEALRAAQGDTDLSRTTSALIAQAEAAGVVGQVTADIDTNSYLFFNVMPDRARGGKPFASR